MTVTEQLKELLKKVNIIQSQQLNLSKRVKALEEKETPSIEVGINNPNFLRWIEETFPIASEEEIAEAEEYAEQLEEDADIAIDEEVLEQLDEIINGDS